MGPLTLSFLGTFEALLGERPLINFRSAKVQGLLIYLALTQEQAHDRDVLGAGLDSFAYRRPDLATLLHIFEVDHPATQQWKRARLRELSIHLPRNLTFIPIDFERQTLADGLRAGGHRPDLPTFFSWLGVTHYITEEAVFSTLQTVAALAPGSEIVFQYFLPEMLFDDENRRRLALWKKGRATVGEPVLSQFAPDALATRLQEFGFTQICDVGPEELDARYFAGRTDGLRARPHCHWRLMKAQV